MSAWPFASIPPRHVQGGGLHGGRRLKRVTFHGYCCVFGPDSQPARRLIRGRCREDCCGCPFPGFLVVPTRRRHPTWQGQYRCQFGVVARQGRQCRIRERPVVILEARIRDQY